ncbi:adenylate kinase [Paenibacillus allorhizosphaerae]|uniref:Adenylate kinase n=1 Tax=Paenibacillus allorhizosphaerae TaxID=2849866 RepID=A0ABM8VHN0_9BACL|nr:adenylate kinase [Paenibacillus allorhizosphaerae]CAG7642371.1 Adenylate kinase [Paenibacillus allorhizosphaerae]
MNIILLGLPGAGKGTQAKIIVEHLHIPHISTGDLFRKAAQERTALGLKAKAYMDTGELVPDEITIGIAEDRLAQSDCKEGFLLDGFPRNLNQAHALKSYLAASGKAIDHVIYVKVDERLLFERLTGRRVCSGCGATYHIAYQPQAVEGRCNSCGGVVIQRDDDQADTVAERLNINKALTDQLADHYKTEGSLRVIDGSKEIGDVTEQLLKIFAAP